MKPLDFEHALYLHSGLTGWTLVSGDPENLTPDSPVTYEQPTAAEQPQLAVFSLDAENNLSMSMNDRPSIVGLDLDTAQQLYRATQTGEVEA